MLIINADDWGSNKKVTDSILDCFQVGVVTSTTAMVYMDDSQRAAEIARSIGLAVGLHLNLTASFVEKHLDSRLVEAQNRLVRYFSRSKYARILFNPFLNKEIQYCFEAQLSEFQRLYSGLPTHIDGHHHMHLCTNMVFGHVLPVGSKIRRNFTFRSTDRNFANRLYRKLIDRVILKDHKSTDFFYGLRTDRGHVRCKQIIDLAVSKNVELMVHPGRPEEREYLSSCCFIDLIKNIPLGTYESV
jgi:predicted glycoside hydrolase/deacetylase ChbG (UPF0249 family)